MGNLKLYLSLFLLLLSLLGGLSAEEVDYRQKIINISQMVGSDIEKADSLSEALLNNETVKQNDTLIAKAYLLRGVVNYNKSRFQLATYFFRKAEKSNYAQGYTDFKAQALNNKGASHERANQYDSALIAYNRSLAIDKDMGDSSDIAETRLNKATIEARMGNLKKAERMFKKANEFFKRDQDTARMGKSYQSLGVVKRKQGDRQRAIQYQQKAQSLFSKIGYRKGEIETLANRSILHANGEDYDKALTVLDSMENVLQSYSDPEAQLGLRLRRARVYVLQGKMDQARQILDSMKQLKPKLRKLENLQYYYVTKLKFAAKQGNLETVNQVFNEYVNRKDSLDRALMNQNIADLKVVHEVKKKNALLDKQEKLLALKTRKNTWLTVGLLIVGGLLITLLIIYQRNKLLHNAVTNLNLSSNLAMTRNEASTEPSESPKYQHIFQDVERMIKKDALYQDPELSLKSLANQMGTNEYYVSRAVNEKSGMNFKSYLNNYRINLAKKLLLEQERPDQSVGEVAEQVGFSNISSFSRTFKQLTGLSPSEFVELNRSKGVSDADAG